ncbi:MAG TPA: thiamine pyrophosphate-dependent dehydrogenase E1 component subunit alpha [Burkholderiales bacterium]
MTQSSLMVAEEGCSAASAVSAQLDVELYKALLRVRHAEETLAELYKEKEMRTPTHFGIGQEAVAVGVCRALAKSDVVYSHHRCHAHYLAKGGSLLGLVAELYGRVDGCSRGRGGSVHLTAPEEGFAGSSPILGQGVALAVGSALAFKMDRAPRVAVTFFGEATCEEGVVYESFNYASVNRLPVLFVCENNLYSTESPLATRQPRGTELCERARAFKLSAQKIDGNDVGEVYATAKRAVDEIRSGKGPFFLECMTYRWREHVGPMFDHELGRTYRTREEVEGWMARCPVARSAEGLKARGLASDDDLRGWLQDVEQELKQVIAKAKASPWPDAKTLFENVC